MSFMLFSCLIMIVSLAVCLLFHEGKTFLQTVLVQEAEEETNTFKKDFILNFVLHCCF